MPKLTRRRFLLYSSLTAAATGLSGCDWLEKLSLTPTIPPAETLPPTPLPTPEATASPQVEAPQDLFHLLNRISFGPHPEELARAREIGADNYIEEQLYPAGIPNDKLAELLEPLTSLDMSPAKLAELDEQVRGAPSAELKLATMLRAIYSRRQLYEVMVDFWTDHFSIYQLKGFCRILKTVDDRQAIRPHALGKFRDLLGASAHSPAMLFYLDNHLSSQDRPNENYARELLELHTLGVDSGYTQQDVQETARCLTGWAIQRRGQNDAGTFAFYPRRHDNGPKTVLGVEISAGGIQDGERVLDILAEHPSTAQFIAAKLCRRFVSDDPSPDLVAEIAGVFTRTGGDIRQVLRAILQAEEFWASAGQKVKRPLNLIASTLRGLEAEIAPQDEKAKAARPTRRAGFQLHDFLNRMGQPLFQWSTPDGYPDTGPAWISTSALWARWQFAFGLTTNRLRGISVDLEAPLEKAGISEPAATLDFFTQRLLGGTLAPAHRDAILAFMGNGDMIQTSPLAVGLLLASPAFQRR